MFNARQCKGLSPQQCGRHTATLKTRLQPCQSHCHPKNKVIIVPPHCHPKTNVKSVPTTLPPQKQGYNHGNHTVTPKARLQPCQPHCQSQNKAQYACNMHNEHDVVSGIGQTETALALFRLNLVLKTGFLKRGPKVIIGESHLWLWTAVPPVS